MDLSKATYQELSDEMFLRHPLTVMTMEQYGMNIEEVREKQRIAREQA